MISELESRITEIVSDYVEDKYPGMYYYTITNDICIYLYGVELVVITYISDMAYDGWQFFLSNPNVVDDVVRCIESIIQ